MEANATAAPAGLPVGIQVGLGTLVVLVATIGAAILPASGGWWRVVPVAIAVLLFSLFRVRAVAAAFSALFGYLMVIGFLVNEYGQLSWHGALDALRMLVIGGAATVGLVAGVVCRQLRRRRRLTVPDNLSAPAYAWRVETPQSREDIRGV